MHSITLISTAHEEIGKCNSDELYKILESIGPEVIFEELPPDLFDKFYEGNQFSVEPLEVKCIKRYLLNHTIKHIPVDIGVSPDLTNSDIEFKDKTIKKYQAFKKLDDEHHFLTGQFGFAHLNSNKCSELFEQMKATEKVLMQNEIARDHLFLIHKLFHEEQDNRENKMLQNIYNYSKENRYNQAVFLIGSGHRSSILKKINEFESGDLKLNWKSY